MDKVSVIVPVYNAEKYISKCIESVISQTYKNLELLLINDGSADNSLTVLREFENRYPEIIKVFTQENKGKEAARNLGLDNASGRYITFLDSDDWIDEDYIQTLRSAIGNNDIVISGYKRFSVDYKFQYASIPENNGWAKFKYCSTAGKMYSSDFINKNNLRYREFNFGEDAYFSIYAYSLTCKISVTCYAGYCNYENPSSVTNTKKYDKENSLCIVIKELDRTISLDKIDNDMLTFFYIKSLVLDILLHKDYVSCRYLTEEFKENIRWYKSVLDRMNSKLNFHSQIGESKNVTVAVNVFIGAYKLHCLPALMWILKRIKVNLI